MENIFLRRWYLPRHLPLFFLTLLAALTMAAAPTASFAGSLTGSGASQSGSSLSNLTTEGTSDWAHWGKGGVPGLDRKSGGGSKISNYTIVGSGTAISSAGLAGFTWTDGTPTASATNNKYGVYLGGVNNGFQFTAPADTTSRTLKVYVAGYKTQGKLTASLSDNSATAYTNTSFSSSGSDYAAVYTLTYSANSAGQTITVKWTTNTDYGSGKSALMAASLAGGGGGSPPSAPTNLVATPGNGKVTLTWTGVSGADSYNIYRGTSPGGQSSTPIAGVTVSPYVNIGLNNGTTYYYKVTAVNSSGESAKSNEASAKPSASFSVNYSDGKIYDPNGNLFVPIGWNLNGTDRSPDTLPFTTDPKSLAWNYNFVRLACWVPTIPVQYQSNPTRNPVNNDPDGLPKQSIIEGFTNRGIVVMIDAHNWIGAYPSDADMDKLVVWFQAAATKYKNNPYVWYQPFNEPGWWKGPIEPEWITKHQRIIKAIRDAGATAPVVCCGAESGGDTTFVSTFNPASSAIVTWGSQLKNFGGVAYSNVMFDVHLYSMWDYSDQKMQDFINACHQQGHAVLCGETAQNGGHGALVDRVFRLCLPAGVGVIGWHGQSGGGFEWVTTGNGYINDINSLTNPTNLLSPSGSLMWNATHGGGYGLIP